MTPEKIIERKSMEAQSANDATPDIVLIHGLWMTPRSWEQKQRYENRGHTVHAPAWPGMEAEPNL